MIRPLHPPDVIRYALLGGPGRSSRTYTLDSLGRETRPRLSVLEAAGLSLSLQNKGVCPLTWTQDSRVEGIAAARTRWGPQTWEIAHLLVKSDDDPECVNLLNHLSQRAAQNGGERIFIRLRSEDPLVDVAMTSGFVPCVHEFLYKGRRQLAPNAQPIPIRAKRPADEYNLFRLYSASTPAKVRFAMGVTFGQWASSRERTRGRCREFVYEKDGQVRGWLGTVQRFGTGKLLLMVHPEDETNLASLIGYGVGRFTGTNTVYCIVPEYQVLLQRLLEQSGFEKVSRYVTLVRYMIAPVGLEKNRRAVTMAPT